MIITSSSDTPGGLPACAPGSTTLAAVDVEWTKNFRVPDGNVPFCISVTWLALPASGAAVSLDAASFSYLSAYVNSPAETRDLTSAADNVLALVLQHAGLLAGHQLCSDLAVLARAAGRPLPAVTELRAAWNRRRLPAQTGPRIIDTRYDIGHLLSGASRRLVDVCAELRLDVTQPELRGTSMTALHRRWTETGDRCAREKISVLNLRHALSTVLAAAYAAGNGHWTPGLNVNQMLAAGLEDAFSWTRSPAFRALLEHRR
jgi:hypothetical protein